ncbi:UvrD-helicase domain-containing protein, partial [Streptococcus pneumoniae]|uniref:UvrD-helicase domain-containing protein n=1 Tax=Streptococcus pneumoniae TaxID=1313 RepID=UPI0018E3581C
ETAEDYIRASRVGRGGQLGRALRKSIWPVFAEYRAQLQAANLREPEEAFREASQLVRKEKPELGIRAMVVDEAQDISNAAFELIRTAVAEAENDLFIVGDAETAEDYIRASRVGRGGQLGRALRKSIWPVFAEY